MTLEELSYMATILGFPAIVFTISLEIWKTGQNRDRETQLELSRRYNDFLRHVLEHPELELADHLKAEEIHAALLDPIQNQQKLVALEILVSLFEDAHFLFSGRWGTLKKQAWAGWESYIAYWMSRADFREAWNSNFSRQYNTSFMSYMTNRWPPG